MRPSPDSHAVGIVHKGDRPLTSIDQWHRFAPPKGDIQWKDGCSAKENARAWLAAAPGLQPDIAQVLAACRDIGPLRRWCAEPEARIPIDSFRGPPNIDLLLAAEDDHGPVVIAIEAKVNETFGDELADRYQRARDERALKPRSMAVARIEDLLDRFAIDIEQRHGPQLRYQLLTATAAVLAEADRRSSERAVLIVHEFVTRCTRPEECKRNAAHLDCFLATALGCEGHLAPGDVAGPILVQGAPTLYVGKAQTVVADATTEEAMTRTVEQLKAIVEKMQVLATELEEIEKHVSESSNVAELRIRREVADGRIRVIYQELGRYRGRVPATMLTDELNDIFTRRLVGD